MGEKERDRSKSALFKKNIKNVSTLFEAKSKDMIVPKRKMEAVNAQKRLEEKVKSESKGGKKLVAHRMSVLDQRSLESAYKEHSLPKKKLFG